ncbi:MAG: hypothetical protein ACFFCV_09295 [Promethearchaeota archaeon]
MNSENLLKIVLIVGGIVEIIIGSLFLFLDIIFKQIGLENIPIFTQMAGSFLLCYGILLVYSARDAEKFLIIPLVNILVRIIMIIFSLMNIFEYPEFLGILLFAIPYDLVWSVFCIILLKINELIFKN